MMNTKELIFNVYKDQVVISKKFKAEVNDKFEISKRDASDIFARIVKYQIKKYGRQLGYDNSHMTTEEARYAHIKANTRKYQKKNNYWEQVKANRKANYL